MKVESSNSDSIFRNTNRTAWIYVGLNLLLITGINYLLLQNVPLAIGVSILIYGASLIFATTSAGEALGRRMVGLHEIKDTATRERLMPLFQEVSHKARQINRNLPSDVQLYLLDTTEVNAVCMGKKSIGLTKGILERPDNEIKAALGHEFGHIAHQDTRLLQMIVVGNWVADAALLVFGLLFAGVMIFATGGKDDKEKNEQDGTGILSTLSFLYLLFQLKSLWEYAGVLLCNKTNRQAEYQADRFAFLCGYGSSLSSFLSTIEKNDERTLWAAMQYSHPDRDDRIAYLHDLQRRAKQLLLKYRREGKEPVIRAKRAG